MYLPVDKHRSMRWGGVLKWGKQQLRGRVIYRESRRQRRSALRFPDSQWLSMGKRGPQEE